MSDREGLSEQAKRAYHEYFHGREACEYRRVAAPTEADGCESCGGGYASEVDGLSLCRACASAPSAIEPGKFRCEMCDGIFDMGDDDEARAEAAAHGINPEDSGLVCDDCWAKTPWGRAEADGARPST